MKRVSVSSIFGSMKKDYASMADVSHETISMLLGKQLRGLPLKQRGVVGNGRRYLC